MSRGSFSLVLVSGRVPNVDNVRTAGCVHRRLGLAVPVCTCATSTLRRTDSRFLLTKTGCVVAGPVERGSVLSTLIFCGSRDGSWLHLVQAAFVVSVSGPTVFSIAK